MRDTLLRTTLDDRRAMKRALLADTFKLRAHYEMRERESFDLVKAPHDGRLGPGLVPFDSEPRTMTEASERVHWETVKQRGR